MKHIINMWTDMRIKSQIIQLSLKHLENTMFKTEDGKGYIAYKDIPQKKKNNHIPLKNRPKLNTFETRQELFEKRKSKKGKSGDGDNDE